MEKQAFFDGFYPDAQGTSLVRPAAKILAGIRAVYQRIFPTIPLDFWRPYKVHFLYKVLGPGKFVNNE